MAPTNTDPSESSPLLQDQTGERNTSAYSSTTLGLGAETESLSASQKHISGDDLERQSLVASGEQEGEVDDEGRQEQYEGIPEVRKLMKYILPALGIGVSQSRSANEMTNVI